ncbi:SCP2 sterol-binding domain-containing protein [Myxococcota bacterium]|nr:SCP2 sterol-binding domain-containing protein [Myxococcota bacterium]
MNTPQRRPAPPPPQTDPPESGWLLNLAREAGADDVAIVSVDHPELTAELPHIRAALPSARTLLTYVVKTSRAPVRAPQRSVANAEFHRASDRVDHVGDVIVRALEARGVAALSPPVGFPMEMDRFPARGWVVSHKLVAQAAGLGKMGLHRNVIHPQFGSFVLLGTVLIGAEVLAELRALDFNPCVNCRLCVAACPVGAIEPSGRFDTAACLTHNYREFMTGFNDFVGQITESEDRWAYRAKVGQAESASWWQSLTSGPHYKAAYCVAACPAGDDVIGAFLADKKGFVGEVVEPLRAKAEPIYVMPGTDAEDHVSKRYPHKTLRRVEGGLYVETVAGFLSGAPMLFQARRSRDVRVKLSFQFTGDEAQAATITIADGRLRVEPGLAEDADAQVTVDGRAWVELLSGRRNPIWLVLTGALKIRGDRAALDRFQSCFPARA